ncbi:hypothetical protein D3C79_941320 [compost metagenome]
MRPQVEVLKDHAQPCAQALQLARVGGAQPATRAAAQFQLFAVDQDLPGVGLLEQVDAAQEGTLARAAGADDADHIAGFGVQRDTLEHLVGAVAFVQVVNFQFVHQSVLGGVSR